MGTNQSFEKVGECLYRNPSSGSYYALVKIRGKQIKQKLKARDLAEARRKLRDFKSDQAKIDPEAGRITVDALGAARAEYRRLYGETSIDVRAVRKAAQRVQELEELRAVLARELLTVV